MRRFLILIGPVVLTALVLVASLRAAEPKPTADKAAKPAAEAKPEIKPEKPPVAEPAVPHSVKRERFQIDVTLRGVFEAQTMAELSVRPEVWQTLEVQHAVEHGAVVKKGDVLIQFDLKKIDEEIADLRLKQAIGELAFKQAEENLKALEASTPLDLKIAERSHAIAHEDREKFVSSDRPMAEKAAKHLLQTAADNLEYEREELRQLEKMYKADDLTEETEEIVLKRQRNAVKAAEFRLEVAKVNYDETLKLDLPRRAENVENATERADQTWAKAKVLLPLALSQARRDMERLKMERSKEAEKLKRLEADREALTVKAPIDGVVYFGRFTRGKWSGADAVSESLRRGGAVTKNTVLLTVVQPRPLFFRGSVPETDLSKLSKGLVGTVEPAAFPDVRLPVTVERVDTIPSAADSYEVRLSVKLNDKAPAIVAGMTGTVKLVSYRQEKAIVVPAKAVFFEPDEQGRYVYLVGKDGKAKKQAVTVGRKADDRLEILGGLGEGEQILLDKPKEDDLQKEVPKAGKERKRKKQAGGAQ
jgi:RND family efflux transporter MFP subunit